MLSSSRHKRPRSSHCRQKRSRWRCDRHRRGIAQRINLSQTKQSSVSAPKRLSVFSDGTRTMNLGEGAMLFQIPKERRRNVRIKTDCDHDRKHRRHWHNRASWPVLRQAACLGRDSSMLFDESPRRIAIGAARPNSHYQAGRHRPPGAGGFRHCTRDEDVPAGPRVSTSPQSTADRIGRTEATESDSQGHVHSLESRHLGTRHTRHSCKCTIHNAAFKASNKYRPPVSHTLTHQCKAYRWRHRYRCL